MKKERKKLVSFRVLSVSLTLSLSLSRRTLFHLKFVTWPAFLAWFARFLCFILLLISSFSLYYKCADDW